MDDCGSNIPECPPGARLVPVSRERAFAIVDAGDYDRVIARKWLLWWRDGTDYRYGINRVMQAGKVIAYLPMHRFILDAPKEFVVDHINHNGLDNRRTNLRLCTRTENTRNSRKMQKSKSLFKGVIFKNGKYTAVVYVNSKPVWAQSFATAIDAAIARDQAAKFYHGKFAYLNFPDRTESAAVASLHALENAEARAICQPQGNP